MFQVSSGGTLVLGDADSLELKAQAVLSELLHREGSRPRGNSLTGGRGEALRVTRQET